jgi:hypothetical protein
MENTETGPRIYSDEEIQPAVQELFSQQHLIDGMKVFLPEALNQLVLKEKDTVSSITEFQARIILPVMKAIEKSSIDKLTTTGLDHLNPNERYLFISNHRDIILDSAFLNTVLFENGFTTGQIAIGDNLMKHRMSELIFRINKSFVVKRTGSPIELYRYSVLLSEYIRKQIVEKIDSVWIAQREGRAKDGNDRTQAGLLKMLSLSCTGDLKQYFQDLNIVPVSISYEYDPCDILKAREYLKKQADPEYKKAFQEDVEQMLLGLRGAKGRVHFHFGTPLIEALEVFDTVPKGKKQLEILASLIDQSIHAHYNLLPVNYVAYDLLMESNGFADHYSSEERQQLETYFNTRCAQMVEEKENAGRKYLLGMYANPVINHLAAIGVEINTKG